MVAGEPWAIYVGRNVSIAHDARIYTLLLGAALLLFGQSNVSILFIGVYATQPAHGCLAFTIAAVLLVAIGLYSRGAIATAFELQGQKQRKDLGSRHQDGHMAIMTASMHHIRNCRLKIQFILFIHR